LYRSLSFGDDDYPDAALSVLDQVLKEAPEENSGEAGRMDLLVDFMKDLPDWVALEAPPRTKRLFKDYLAARDASEIPEAWKENVAVNGGQSHPHAVAAPTPPPLDDTPDWAAGWAPQPATTTEVTVRPAETEPVQPPQPTGPKPSIFIVHGHDEAALNSIRIYVYKETGIMPTSLAEEPGRGQTIIEKFENTSGGASYVIVLLTPDDVGQTVADHEADKAPQPRARQNVVLELGYFIGKVGRQNVVVIDADVERPSDLAGLSYIAYPGENWKDALRTELVAASLV